tara:strand:+ start:1747 stop:2019 length:273 start_codon:yes stop_codon:yes gene_type:complete
MMNYILLLLFSFSDGTMNQVETPHKYLTECLIEMDNVESTIDMYFDLVDDKEVHKLTYGCAKVGETNFAAVDLYKGVVPFKVFTKGEAND